MTSARAAAIASPEAGDRLWTVPYVLALLSALLFFSAFYLALAALPKYLKDQLGTGTGEIGLVLGLFAVTAIAPRPFIGRLVNGGITLAPMLICAVIFMLANLFYAGATTIPLLIAVRLFHGGGMAGYTTAAPSLVATITPAPRRGEAMAYWGVANTLALAACPALGLALAGRWGYPACFGVAAVVGAAAVFVTALLRPRNRPTARPPLPPPGPLLEARVLLPALACFVMMLGYGVIITFIIILADERHIAGSGFFFTIYAAGLLVARAIAGRLSDRYGRWIVAVPGIACLAISLVVAALAYGLPLLAVAALLAGAGFGAAQPALLALTVDLVPHDRRGSAVATYYVAHESGIATGSIALGWVAQAITTGGMFALTGAALLVAIAALGLHVWRAGQERFAPV
ncbi:MAG TPA: MFS transporter [Thermomicrobiales bacterium]|jgi:MFS family permease